ncbi:hypothetical protein [Pseudorhodobacter aquimaris]|uniref:hypothetical protein n=1 Tax=Pseudorhodobacter aquimaris TaxID=687412 RepID=UPI00067BAEB9|nr:hypothetical protein [Pseudorhodobacter aquimaris]
MIIGFGLIFVWYGIEYAQFGLIQNSLMMRANLIVTFISVPIAGAFWAIFAGYRLFEEVETYRTTRSVVK